MITDKEVIQFRKRLKGMDDGSSEFEEMYATLSWFTQKFLKFHEKRKKISEVAIL